jgi:thymidylate kinase
MLIAVEGACCAGKTTLATALIGELADLAVGFVPCYADFVGGGRFLPDPVPTSLDEDQVALDALLEIEAARLAAVRSGQHDLALLDRSVHTLLAHRYAVERLTGLRCYEPAARTLSLSPTACWPDLVIYLDVRQRAVEDRNRGKFPTDSIFIDPRFNAAVRGYYEALTTGGVHKIAWLDAGLDRVKVVDLAQTRIRALLSGQD